jgi:murein DD-endopeptidase MepM/ murein hydrolase activator NlpD
LLVPPADVAPLAPLPNLLAEDGQIGPVAPMRAGLGMRIVVLAAGAALAERERPRFPVRGPFNWGQESARFGSSRGGRRHDGQDVMSRTGTPVVAVTGSEVIATGDDGGRGNYVALYDARRRRTFVYLHLERPVRLRIGTRVVAGQRVGALGCTGSCDGPHLHLEMRAGRGLDGAARDPQPPLLRWARADGIPATLPPGAH